MNPKRQSLRDITTRVERHVESRRHQTRADHNCDDPQKLAAAEISFVDRYSRLLAAARSKDEAAVVDKPKDVGAERG